MRHFVTENRGKLRFRVEVGQQTSMHIDKAATGGECVDRIVIENDELPFRVRQLALARNALTNLADVILQSLIFVQSIRFQDLIVRLAGRCALLGRPFGRLRQGLRPECQEHCDQQRGE